MEQKKSFLNTTVPVELRNDLKMLADEKGLPMNTILEEAIRDLLEKYSVKERQPKQKRSLFRALLSFLPGKVK